MTGISDQTRRSCVALGEPAFPIPLCGSDLTASSSDKWWGTWDPIQQLRVVTSRFLKQMLDQRLQLFLRAIHVFSAIGGGFALIDECPAVSEI